MVGRRRRAKNYEWRGKIGCMFRRLAEQVGQQTRERLGGLAVKQAD
jgi:hypothetical protein